MNLISYSFIINFIGCDYVPESVCIDAEQSRFIWCYFDLAVLLEVIAVAVIVLRAFIGSLIDSAHQQIFVCLSIFRRHNHIYDGIDTGCKVDQNVAHDVDCGNIV